MDRMDEAMIKWYRSFPPASRAKLLAQGVLAGIGTDNPDHRALAEMVLADMEARHV
jgi:hypothetical protein